MALNGSGLPNERRSETRSDPSPQILASPSTPCQKHMLDLFLFASSLDHFEEISGIIPVYVCGSEFLEKVVFLQGRLPVLKLQVSQAKIEMRNHKIGLDLNRLPVSLDGFSVSPQLGAAIPCLEICIRIAGIFFDGLFKKKGSLFRNLLSRGKEALRNKGLPQFSLFPVPIGKGVFPYPVAV
jgi:hypothetical protein